MSFDIISTGLEFGMPVALLALVPVLGILVAQAWQQRAAAVVSDISPLAAAVRSTWRTRLRWLPGLLRALAIIALIVAVARPREGLAVTSLPEEGIDIVAVVDVSTSMLQSAGSNETRLQAARRVLDDFAGTLRGDRMGLVAFQERALTLSPLTNDLEAIRGRLEQLRPGLVEDGTAIGLGITEALTLLEESPALSRVVVLLTDGENNAGDVEPFVAARVAEAMEVRIYTVGFAPSRLGGSVDAPALEQLAETTGGAYFDARTTAELEEAYEQIGALERSRVGDREFVSWREFGPWFALAAAGMVLAESVLRSTWLRRAP